MLSDRVTGLALKLERVGADIKLKDLAAAMGISDSRVSRIEDAATITPDMERRYRQALDKCRTSGTRVA